MKIGAGKCEIVFDRRMLPLDGCREIHDNPCVRIILLESDLSAAIVSYDLVNLIPEYVEVVKNLVNERTGVLKENIWVHTTHAISTPHIPRDFSDGEKRKGLNKRELYLRSVTESTIKAVGMAYKNMQGAKMGVSQGICDINMNRDVETAAGWWIGFNEKGISNKTATIIRFDSFNGHPLAMIISYGIRPSAIDNAGKEAGNRIISADIPGKVCSLLENKYKIPVLFLMPAAGDQVPKQQAFYEKVCSDGSIQKVDLGSEEGIKIVERLGARMFIDVEGIAEKITCESIDIPMFCGRTSIDWQKKRRVDMKPCREIDYIPDGKISISTEYLVIGDTVFVGVRPEVNAITERALKESSPFKNTILVTMVNGGMKYMPDMEAYRKITWEALCSGLMPGAAEAWLEHVCNKLKEIYAG